MSPSGSSNAPEAKARTRIDQALAESGWTLQDRDDMNLAAAPAIAVREFKLDRGHGYVDYMLFLDGHPVGVCEAKPAGAALIGVEHQVKKYVQGIPAALATPYKPLPFAYLSTGQETLFINHFDPHPRTRPVFSFHRPDTLREWLTADTLDAWLKRSDGFYTAADDTKPSTLRARLRAMPPVELAEVRNIEITSRGFGQVQLHRNNRFYDFLMKVCELIHRNLLISEASGRSRFRDFSRDRQQMAVLYESFVRNFYRIHSRYKVKREDIYRNWIAEDQVAAGLLPKMQTDISLTADGRKIIIDCKYTPEATQHHYDANTLRSAHLYQINAYLDNLSSADSACEAMLLYPTVDKPLSASYAHKAHRISIRTINLNQPWPDIHRDLLALVA